MPPAPEALTLVKFGAAVPDGASEDADATRADRAVVR
jgi:hypothetical protein